MNKKEEDCILTWGETLFSGTEPENEASVQKSRAEVLGKAKLERVVETCIMLCLKATLLIIFSVTLAIIAPCFFFFFNKYFKLFWLFVYF